MMRFFKTALHYSSSCDIETINKLIESAQKDALYRAMMDGENNGGFVKLRMFTQTEKQEPDNTLVMITVVLERLGGIVVMPSAAPEGFDPVMFALGIMATNPPPEN